MLFELYDLSIFNGNALFYEQSDLCINTTLSRIVADLAATGYNTVAWDFRRIRVFADSSADSAYRFSAQVLCYSTVRADRPFGDLF